MMNRIIKVWVSKGEFTLAEKNKNQPSKIDIADDYGYVWFAKESIPDRRGMVEATLTLTNQDDEYRN